MNLSRSRTKAIAIALFLMFAMVISSLAEEKAKKRESLIVENEDMVEAFIEGTPEPFQQSMREGLIKYGLLDK